MNRGLRRLVVGAGEQRRYSNFGSEEARQAGIKAAHRALDGAKLIFVSKETLGKLTALMGEAPTNRSLRQLIDGIAAGTFAVVKKGTVATVVTADGGNGALYTVGQVARMFKVSSPTIRSRCVDGRIVAVNTGKQGRRYFRVAEEEITRLREIGLK